MITAVAFIVLAGSGAVARAIAARHLNDPEGIAWGTMAVNVSGSLALGLLTGLGPPLATVVGTGLIGAYTTFSSFARDTLALLERNRIRLAIVYVLGTVGLCLAAAAVALTIRGR